MSAGKNKEKPVKLGYGKCNMTNNKPAEAQFSLFFFFSSLICIFNLEKSDTRRMILLKLIFRVLILLPYIMPVSPGFSVNAVGSIRSQQVH